MDRDSYYYNYFPKSIYYKRNGINYLDMNQIIFEKKIINLNSILYHYKKNNNNIFTLNDISKFIILKKKTQFDDLFLEDIIFKNKRLAYYNEEENQSNNTLSNNMECDFAYKNNSLELIMAVNNKYFSIKASEILENLEEEKNTLSFEQRKCLIFLGLAVKSKMACIVQGGTGVGKSHLIKLFAKILGKKLNLILLKDLNIIIQNFCKL